MRQSQAMAAGTPTGQAKAIAGLPARITAAGSTAATATPITEALTVFGTAAAGGGAFVASNPGDTFYLTNVSGNTVTLYPSLTAGTVTINDTTSLSFPTNKSVIVWFETSTKCYAIPFAPT